MQCAAVISRSRSGLVTTLAVQKWFVLPSRTNSAPTRSASTLARAGPDCPRDRRPLPPAPQPTPSVTAWTGWLAVGAEEHPPVANTTVATATASSQNVLLVPMSPAQESPPRGNIYTGCSGTYTECEG